jgi:hypothetical protein
MTLDDKIIVQLRRYWRLPRTFGWTWKTATVLVLLDFFQAFDMDVHVHELLLDKMRHYQKLLQSYLSGRAQFVKWDARWALAAGVNCCVPEGHFCLCHIITRFQGLKSTVSFTFTPMIFRYIADLVSWTC